MNIVARSPKDNEKLEKAINFLIFSIKQSGKNPKPVIVHSIRVAFYLDYLGFSTEVVIAALLHDLLEDSEVKLEKMERLFGRKVAILVSANSFDEKILDKATRDKLSLNKVVGQGKEAALIKAVDILDNSDYYQFTEKETLERLLNKMKYFLEISKDLLKGELVYKDLAEKFERLCVDQTKSV